ncbi:MAG TPA: 16S rRNA (cytidine(1402)-2'-O)-methyltransferase [Deltaproteobacteria bacterium]|nr:MAG: 16S rRNA (cytidine(1402)-2'-O)-methyltransferase [Deltaproteobacteria bacterium GWA2_55_82]OGQ62421.1 MAG: 16S rRNA (cytidine(1402)-2'-O)-methyltransferase [Deltaproteobacteria bacterium RIFCSPLOWO2_02_FULL_55_12]OIJ73335.1 MAG: 16S rRNA (cytidine(1402)-2'-O)-methyltransferase [Deltaproteobacteria bacterium GWC2_55_46]HBG45391.1 16S rRNA (cytidine(1402)-2'-O)-methyltransferase [Deltaproteobacteria bacterium]HCY10222.1 16S rRNA (cytidine(1402)-2'-O)-methyltransferase [Deltaproteobacteria
MSKGKLFVVATPIGNLEDVTLRALRVLKEAGLIAAEDTRHTRRLLDHYGIDTPLTSYHEHNEREKSGYLVGKLMEGTDIALVSDAGTPGISDPGYRLIKSAAESSVDVVAIPGPSAIISLVSVAGLPTDEFTFAGFLPEKEAALKEYLSGISGRARTFVFYESPRRLKATLEAMLAILGDIQAAVGRELTKVHEEVLRGRISEILAELGDKEVRGEITLAVRTEDAAKGDFRPALESLLATGAKLNDAVKAIAKDFSAPRAEVYKEALSIREKTRKG